MNKFLLEIPDRMEAEQLYLRSYKAGDGPMYYAASLRNRGHLAEFESGNVLMQLRDEEHAEATVRELAAEWMARNCFFISIFEKATDEWSEQVYVEPTNWELPEFSIGFVADVNYEGKGYLSEAVNCVLGMLFGEMGAHRVKSDCNENNIRSWQLLERCGFRREGHLIENRRTVDGSFHGDYLYGLLRREYVDR
jgi:RimJ/RimL family protein N-acetyltransferase